jgi:hypothetical protein
LNILVSQSSFDYCRTAHYVRYRCLLSGLVTLQCSGPVRSCPSGPFQGQARAHFIWYIPPPLPHLLPSEFLNICSPFAALSSSSQLYASSRLSYLKSGISRSPQSELPEIREATRAAFCLLPSLWRRQLRGSIFLVLPPSSTVRTARPCTSPAYIDTTRRTNPPL